MSPRQQKASSPGPNGDIRSLRESAGLSQAELAGRMGYSLKTIQRWEGGDAKPRRIALEFLHSVREKSASAVPKNGAREFRFIDLFAGIGGLRRGFESVGGRCVYTSEWDKHAVQTYRENFDCSHGIAGDITQVEAEEIPAHDVLLAGFPCQPFSIAGVSKKNALGRPHGFACDTQGTLFFDVARILSFHRPAAFMLENVKNLASHDGGRTFATIKNVLTEELGYQLHTKVIDGGAFVPQHRERVYLVGFREPNDFSWNRLTLPAAHDRPRLRSILHPEDGTEAPEPAFTDENGRVLNKYVLTDNLWKYLQDYAAKHRAAGNGFGFGLVGPDDIARTLSARYYKDGSEILIRRDAGAPRRLTPRECARLMGFDRPGTDPFRIVVSDTQAYRQFGNSVVVPVVEAVAELMRPYLTGRSAGAVTHEQGSAVGVG